MQSFVFLTAYILTCTLTFVHLHCRCNLFQLKITVIFAIRCPFPQASWCLSEIWTVRNTCSLSVSLWVILILPGNRKKRMEKTTSSSLGGSKITIVFKEFWKNQHKLWSNIKKKKNKIENWNNDLKIHCMAATSRDATGRTLHTLRLSVKWWIRAVLSRKVHSGR